MSKLPAARSLDWLWYGRSPLAALLQPLSWMFAGGAALRRLAYSRGWLRSWHPGVPVIVVGNITVGGAGKTPIVAWLVGRLRAQGWRPAIVSRGHGGRTGHKPVMVTAVSLAADVGDEPLLLARRTAAPVVVCRSRARAARLAAAAGADVIVADDGLQHYALGRDLEIIVLDGERQLGNGRLLPAGPLREPASRLETAGLVLVNGGLPARGQIGFVLRGTSVVRLNGVERREPASFAGQKAWALAGIGNPSRFYAELRRHGIEPVPVAVPDHGRVDIGQLRRHAHGPLLMTEKDAVKYADCADSEAWYLPVDVDMPAAAEALIMARVGAALNRRQRGVPRGAFQ